MPRSRTACNQPPCREFHVAAEITPEFAREFASAKALHQTREGQRPLTIRGEKKNGREEKRQGYYLAERSYGAFHRAIALPPGVDSDKAKAEFKKGILTISLPKTPEARSRVKKIEVKAA